MRRFFRTSFGSAVLGGSVVAAFGWVAIAAGWIEAEGGGSTVAVSQPLAAPVASEDDGDGNLVNQIYRRDGQGVAFVSAERPDGESPGLSPFGQPEGGGTASGSGVLIETEGDGVSNSRVVGGGEEGQVRRQLKQNGEVKHAYLGISGGGITPDLAKALKLSEQEGVLVSEVVKGGPAEQAGVRGGDTSATIEGASVDRGGKSKTIAVKLGVRPDSAEEVPSR